jgi:hypothetical protein
MTAVLMEYSREKRESQRRIELDKGLRDGLADLCRRRWPSGTAKSAARAFGLTHDQGRSIVAGKASLTTLELALKNGGWSVVFPLLAEVIGETAEQYLIEARKTNEKNGERLTSLVSNMWALGPVADPRSTDLDDRTNSQRRSFNRRVG